jgi:hypothetical protein
MENVTEILDLLFKVFFTIGFFGLLTKMLSEEF